MHRFGNVLVTFFFVTPLISVAGVQDRQALASPMQDTYTGASPEKKSWLTGVIRCVVRGEDGKPVANALVRLIEGREPQIDQAATTTTDGRGRFRFYVREAPPFYVERKGDDIGTNGIVITITNPDNGESAILFPTDLSGYDIYPVRLRKAQTATLRGVVVDPDNNPIKGVPIHFMTRFPRPLIDEHGKKRFAAFSGGDAPHTDADGRFEITNLFPGVDYSFKFGRGYRVGVSQGFGVTRYPDLPLTAHWDSFHVQFKAGEVRDIGHVQVLYASGEITGKLVDDSGKPVSNGASLILLGQHTNDYASVSKTDGSFQFSGLPDEPMELLIFPKISPPNFNPMAMAYPYKRPIRTGLHNVRIVIPSQIDKKP